MKGTCPSDKKDPPPQPPPKGETTPSGAGPSPSTRGYDPGGSTSPSTSSSSSKLNTEGVGYGSKYTTKDGKEMVKTTSGWKYSDGSRPTERDVINAQGALTEAKKAAKAAKPSGTVSRDKFVREVGVMYDQALDEANALRDERNSIPISELHTKEGQARKKELMAREAALRQEAGQLNLITGGRQRSPIELKGTISIQKYNEIMDSIKAREALRPYVYADPRTGKISIDIPGALDEGVGEAKPSADERVARARMQNLVEDALLAIGVSPQAISQGKQFLIEQRKVNEAMEQFLADHIALGDGNYISRTDWTELLKTYPRLTAKIKDAAGAGYEAILAVINSYHDEAVKFMDKYQMLDPRPGFNVPGAAPTKVPDLYGAVKELMQTGQYDKYKHYLNYLYGEDEVARVRAVALTTMPTWSAAPATDVNPIIAEFQALDPLEKARLWANPTEFRERFMERIPTEKELMEAVYANRTLTPIEYAWLVKPDNMSNETYAKIAPFITPGSVNIQGAVEAGVPDRTILQVCGDSCTKTDLEDAKWQAEYDRSPYPKKVTMTAQKDPGGFAKNIAISAAPVYGTIHFWDEMQPWERALSITGDVLFFIPIIKGISVGVKSGMTVGRATMQTARGVLVSQYQAFRHPIQTLKQTFEPLEMLFRPKAQPLAVVWRGQYEPGWGISKVTAGGAPELTRDTMGQISRVLTKGDVTDDVIRMANGDVIEFSGTGLQKILNNKTIHATPFGAEWTTKGLEAKLPIFTAPEGYYYLTMMGATGEMANYVAKGDDIIGMLGKAGEVLDPKGKTVIGKVKVGSNAINFNGKKIGVLDDAYQVVDSKGQIIGKLKDGRAIVSTGNNLEGIIYNLKKKAYGFVVEGKPYTFGGEDLGKIKGGQVLDKSNKVIGNVNTTQTAIKKYAPEITIGMLPDDTKMVSVVDQSTIGKLQTKPAFAVIQTTGVQALPDEILKAKNIEEMERIATRMFEKGDLPPGLYETFKQYKKWIELENIYPKGSRFLPVLDDAGKPVMLYTRGAGGEKVAMPFLQEVDPDWLTKAKKLLQQVEGQTLKPRTIDLKAVKNMPSKSAKEVLSWIKKKKGTVYGSLAEYVQGGKFKPNDIDLAIANPRGAAEELGSIINKTSGKQTRVLKTMGDGAAVEVLDNGLWKKVVDLHSPQALKDMTPKGFKVSTVELQGVKMESITTQMQNLLRRMEMDWSKGAHRFNSLAREWGVNLGVGAEPPTLAQLYKLKARGIYNTIRDIFKRGLTKKQRLNMTKQYMPDMADDVDELLRLEDQLDSLKKRKTGKLSPSERGLVQRQKVAAQQLYDRLYKRLKAEGALRATMYSKLLTELPARMSQEATRKYEELLRPINTRAPGWAKQYPLGPAVRSLVSLARKNALPRRGYATRLELSTPIRRGAPRKPESRTRLEVRRQPDRKRGHPPKPKPKPHTHPRGRVLEFPAVKAGSTRKPPDLDMTGIRFKGKPKAGAIAWRQGRIRQGKKLQDVWHVIETPYKDETSHYVLVGELPPGINVVKGGDESAYRSIQLFKGRETPHKLEVDLGIMDITISGPTRDPGKMGSIAYEPDVKEKTSGDVTIGEQEKETSKVRAQDTKGLNKLPLSTTLKQLMDYKPKSASLKKFADEISLPAKLQKHKPKAIAEHIKTAQLDQARTKEVLKHLPDRVKREVEFYLAETVEYAPTRGYPKVKRPLTIRRRGRSQKLKEKKEKKKKKLKSNGNGQVEVTVSNRSVTSNKKLRGVRKGEY